MLDAVDLGSSYQKRNDHQLIAICVVVAIIQFVLLQGVSWSPTVTPSVLNKVRITLDKKTAVSNEVPVSQEIVDQEVVDVSSEPPSISDTVSEQQAASPVRALDSNKLNSQILNAVTSLVGEPDATGLVPRSNPWSGKIAAAPSRKESVNSAGMTITRIVDRWGNVRCLQQRGDPFDPETWRYHAVPASLCGHLE